MVLYVNHTSISKNSPKKEKEKKSQPKILYKPIFYTVFLWSNILSIPNHLQFPHFPTSIPLHICSLCLGSFHSSPGKVSPMFRDHRGTNGLGCSKYFSTNFLLIATLLPQMWSAHMAKIQLVSSVTQQIFTKNLLCAVLYHTIVCAVLDHTLLGTINTTQKKINPLSE